MPVHKKIAKLGKTVGKAAIRSLKRSARIAFKPKRKSAAKKRIKSFLKKRLRPTRASSVTKSPRRRRKLLGPAFTGRRNPIQRPGISGNPRRRSRAA